MSENAGAKTTLQLVFVYGRDIFLGQCQDNTEKKAHLIRDFWP